MDQTSRMLSRWSVLSESCIQSITVMKKKILNLQDGHTTLAELERIACKTTVSWKILDRQFRLLSTKIRDCRAVQKSALCRSRRELSNAYFLAKFGFDTAENEPCQVCHWPAGTSEPGSWRSAPPRGPARPPSFFFAASRPAVLSPAPSGSPAQLAAQLALAAGLGGAWINKLNQE